MRQINSPTGRLTIRLVDPRTGEVKLSVRAQNLVTLGGRRLLSRLMSGVTDVRAPVPIEIVVGGTLGVDPSPTLLTTEALDTASPLVVEADIGATEQQLVDGTTRVVTTITATLEANPGGDDLTLTEAGIRFSPAEEPTPVLYNRVVFGPITKNAELQMTLSWEVIF
ncbi:MAG: hypothetical protein K0V04_18905 [Deltaproteobacteria bacterium]|nr:hypothetical protein [Deltaproteobacteria bacterium]